MSGDIFSCRTWDGCYWHLWGAAQAAYSTGQTLVFREHYAENELSGQLTQRDIIVTSPQQSDPDPNVGGAEA